MPNDEKLPKDGRAAALRTLLGRFAMAVDANAVAVLWDGTTVPLGTTNTGDAPLEIAIRSPAAVTRLVRRPSLATLFELVATGQIEVEGMSPLDAASHWDHIRVVRFARSLGPIGLIRSLWPFALGAGGRGGALAFSGSGDAAEVRHHYDVSNDFYRLFLDEGLVYSCAYFDDPRATLYDAQRAKLDISCRKLRLRPGQRILDIGCGWGGLAIHAAREYGVTVVGITLAEEQFALARERVAAAGLASQIDIRLADWRDLTAEDRFDRIVQIGMYEHVGRADQAAFLRTVHEHLVPDGVYLHHAIVRRHRGNGRRKSPYMKVIDRFIFPGGELDHIGRSLEQLELAGFEPHDSENWRWHYALTCRRWSERLWARREEAIATVGEDVTRMWLLYLAMVTIGFERAVIGIHQTVCTPRRKGAPPIPPTRADLYRSD